MRRHFRTTLAPDSKADESPVTVADREAEQAMRGYLERRFPGHGVLGEEFGADRQGASHCWVLDPIDGTRAFITGKPIFGTLIALLRDGVPILGIIDQPVTGERWIGVAGEPTRFAGPLGGAIGTRACPSLGEAELSCTSPELLGAEEPRWRRLADQVRRVSWGGDCYGYGLLALGQIDIIAECNMKLWDYAALVPIIDGAGGQVTTWSGEVLGPGSDGTVIAAGTKPLHRQAVAALQRDQVL